MNTLLVQNVLTEPAEWTERLTGADLRGLTPCSGPTSTGKARPSGTARSSSTFFQDYSDRDYSDNEIYGI
jgi:hypothetical protein